jgi:hypothetical protein
MGILSPARNAGGGLLLFFLAPPLPPFYSPAAFLPAWPKVLPCPLPHCSATAVAVSWRSPEFKVSEGGGAGMGALLLCLADFSSISSFMSSWNCGRIVAVSVASKGYGILARRRPPSPPVPCRRRITWMSAASMGGGAVVST